MFKLFVAFVAFAAFQGACASPIALPQDTAVLGATPKGAVSGSEGVFEGVKDYYGLNTPEPNESDISGVGAALTDLFHRRQLGLPIGLPGSGGDSGSDPIDSLIGDLASGSTSGLPGFGDLSVLQ